MGVSTQQVLSPQTILSAITQMALPGTTLQTLFGWGVGGENRLRSSGRNFSYDLFDHTRRVATGRAPGQAASRRAPQRVGHVQGVFPRAAETISLLDEDLLNLRRLGGPTTDLDPMGENYVTRQEAYLAQRFSNLIEFQTAAMLRGSYSYVVDGDDLRHGFQTGGVVIDYRIPPGNRNQLDLLGQGNLLSADWANPDTDIPGQLQQINAAMVQLHGMGMSRVIVTSAGWQLILSNKRTQAQGGSANVPFQTMQRVSSGEFTATLRAIPWVTFHIVDYGLEVWNGTEETFTKLIEDDHAVFLPEPSASWAQYLEGSEIVTEGPGGARQEQFGFYPFAYPTHDPSGWDLAAVLNGIPALYVPSAIAYGKITGGVYV